MIDAYLRSLRAALGDRLPPSVGAARLREAEGHLRMAAEDVGEAEAVRRYGPARKIANESVRQHRGYATASAWRLTRGVGFVLLLALALPYGWLDLAGKRDPTGVDAAITAVRWVPFLALLLFAARALQTRRWLVLPMVPFAALSSTLVMAVAALVPFPAPSAGNFAGQRSMIAFWKESEDDVRAWRHGAIPTERVPVPSTKSYVARENVPMTPIDIATERRAGLGPNPSTTESGQSSFGTRTGQRGQRTSTANCGRLKRSTARCDVRLGRCPSPACCPVSPR